ncbi:MAG: HAD family hydrolase [Patescibacteria group bacterium]
MNLTSKKYLVFDFDRTIDTLIIDWSHSREGWLKLAKELTGDTSLVINGNPYVFQAEVIDRVGQPAIEAFQTFTKEYEQQNYTNHEPNMRLVQFIQENQTRFQFFLWTSNHLETIQPVLQDLGLEQSFRNIITRDAVDYPKPRPAGFDQIFIPGTSKKDYLMIGDSENDQLAAAAAGIDFIDVVDFEELI